MVSSKEPTGAVVTSGFVPSVVICRLLGVRGGGSLFIDWRSDNHVVMSGPVAVAFTGALDIAVGAA